MGPPRRTCCPPSHSPPTSRLRLPFRLSLRVLSPNTLLLCVLATFVLSASRAAAYGAPGGAMATFYGGPDASGTWGGNCGYGNLVQAGYGILVAAGSPPLYKGGKGCGACYRVKCTNSTYCNKGVSIVVAITDLCPGGGWCCPTCRHFDLSEPAFIALANRAAGFVPLSYEQVPCVFSNNIRLTATGSPFWLNLLIRQVAGPGDLSLVEVMDSNSPTWRPMRHDWGANWVYESFLQAPLKFRLTSLTDNQQVVTNPNCLPAGWVPAKDYDCNIQFSFPGDGMDGNHGGPHGDGSGLSDAAPRNRTKVIRPIKKNKSPAKSPSTPKTPGNPKNPGTPKSPGKSPSKPPATNSPGKPPAKPPSKSPPTKNGNNGSKDNKSGNDNGNNNGNKNGGSKNTNKGKNGSNTNKGGGSSSGGDKKEGGHPPNVGHHPEGVGHRPADLQVWVTTSLGKEVRHHQLRQRLYQLLRVRLWVYQLLRVRLWVLE
ncbi:unnamed protein product [Closterium sp. Yama58-4]|nr:unnamed protein product [Closterium sp. Yama58-4]